MRRHDGRVALAVCILFDAEGERVIRGLWARLESRGVPTPLTHTHGRHHPHLSLAVARTWDLDAVLASVAALPPALPVRLACQGIVAFPRGRAALAVAVSVDLARRQEAAVAAVMATGADLHHYYLPGRWVPHVSIATGGNADQLPIVATTVTDTLPLSVTGTRAALVDSSTGETWPLPALI